LEGEPLQTGGDFAWGFADPAAPDRVFTVTAIGARGTVARWQLADRAQPKMVEDPYDFPVVRSAAPVATISSDGALLAVGDLLRGTGKRAVYNVESGALVGAVDDPPGEFVPGTHTLATVGIDRITFRDATTGVADSTPLTGLSYPRPELVFSADGG